MENYGNKWKINEEDVIKWNQCAKYPSKRINFLVEKFFLLRDDVFSKL